MNECFRALFGPDAFRPLVEYDAAATGELLTTFRLSFLRPYVDLSFSQRHWWISSLLGHHLVNFTDVSDELAATVFRFYVLTVVFSGIWRHIDWRIFTD